MTRFARAKGSKASNERVPEEATTWTELKKQLKEKLKREETHIKAKEADELRTKNYKEFLKEKEDEEIRQSKWADFSDVENISGGTVPKQTKKRKAISPDEDKPAKISKLGDNGVIKNKKSKQSKKLDTGLKEGEKSAKITKLGDVGVIKNKKSKQSMKLETGLNDGEKPAKITISTDEGVVKKSTKKKKNKAVETVMKQVKSPTVEPAAEMSEAEKLKLEKKKQRRKQQAEKRKLKFLQKTTNDGDKPTTNTKPNLSEDALKKLEKKKEKKIKQLEKRKQFKAMKLNDPDNKTKPSSKKVSFDKMKNKQSTLNKIGKAGTVPKPKLNKEPKRKKPIDQTTKVVINGKEIELIRFDGYPVKKEDHERLVKLKKEMISKGIPRSEVNHTMKLERRKAEKALAREKKNVCFNCRQACHVLSECPNLNDEMNGTGICFKCGSTEHTHFECKVVRNQEYKFATCFICKEEGHIARQCPDNARGLYPKGGACRVCGDVTHLKKDCPQFQQQQESDNIYANTIGDNNIEALDNESIIKVNDVKKTTNKVIKF